jgi:DNA polymerase-3 subunit beta
VLWHSVDGKLVAIATNGVQLIRTEITAGMFSPGHDLIVPIEPATQLLKLAKRARFDRVMLRRDKRLLSVSAAGFSFITRLLDFTFPDYTRVLPTMSNRAAVADRVALADALARLVAVADDGDRAIVALEWAAGSNLMHIMLARQAADGHDSIEATIEGDGEATLVAGRIAEILREFPANARLRLEDAGAQWPLLIRCGDRTAAITRYLTRDAAQAA